MSDAAAGIGPAMDALLKQMTPKPDDSGGIDGAGTNDLVPNMPASPKSETGAAKLAADTEKAKKVRAAFLDYRTQITTSLEILANHSDADDETSKDMQRQLTGLLIVLDKLDKRKRVTADTLLDFVHQMSSVGAKMQDITDDPDNKSRLALELRRRKEEILDNDEKQDKRFKELSVDIGQPLERFLERSADLVGTGGGSALKIALASWLGPAAPIISVLDSLIDIDGTISATLKGLTGWTKKGVGLMLALPKFLSSKASSWITKGVKSGFNSVTSTLNTWGKRAKDRAKTGLRVTAGLPVKMAKAASTWSATLIEVMKTRWRSKDTLDARAARGTKDVLTKTLGSIKSLSSKLKSLAKSVGGMAMNLLLGLGGLLGKLARSFGSLITSSLIRFLPIGRILKLLTGLMSSGAAKVMRNAGGLSAGASALSKGKEFAQKVMSGVSGTAAATWAKTKGMSTNALGKARGAGASILTKARGAGSAIVGRARGASAAIVGRAQGAGAAALNAAKGAGVSILTKAQTTGSAILYRARGAGANTVTAARDIGASTRNMVKTASSSTIHVAKAGVSTTKNFIGRGVSAVYNILGQGAQIAGSVAQRGGKAAGTMTRKGMQYTGGVARGGMQYTMGAARNGMQYAGGVARGGMQYAGDASRYIGSMARQGGQTVGSAASSARDLARTGSQFVGTVAQRGGKAVGTATRSGMQYVGRTTQSIGSMARRGGGAINSALSTAGNLTRAGSQAIGTVAPRGGSVVGTMARTGVDSVKSFAGKGATALSNTARSGVGSVTSFVGRGADKVSNAAQKSVSAVKSVAGKGSNLLSSTAKMVKSVPASLAAKGTGVAGSLASKAGGAVSMLSKGAKVVGSVGSKALGGVGGLYGMVTGYSDVRANKGKGFLEGGLNSRAGGYASSIMGGASAGAMMGSVVPVIGTAVGAVVGAAVGTLTAAVADNQDKITATLSRGWESAKKTGGELVQSANRSMLSSVALIGASPLAAAIKTLTQAIGLNSDNLKKFALDGARGIRDSIKSSTGLDVANAVPESVRGYVRQASASANFKEVKGDLVNAAQKTGVSAGTLTKIVNIESGFRKDAQPPVGKDGKRASSAGGLGQFTDSTWKATLAKHGKKHGLGPNTSKFDSKANALMLAEHTKDNKALLESKEGLGTQANDTMVYMAHFMGATGAIKFIRKMTENPNTAAASVFPREAQSNPSVFYKDKGKGAPYTLREVYDSYTQKLASGNDLAGQADKAAADKGFVPKVAASLPTSTVGTANTPSDSIGKEAADRATNHKGKPAAVNVGQASVKAIPSKPADAAAYTKSSAATNSAQAAHSAAISSSGHAKSQAPAEAKAIPRVVTEADLGTVTNDAPNGKGNSGSGSSKTGAAASSNKATLQTVPFFPDDTQLLALNIYGLIGG